MTMRVALVTGSATGIGAVLARDLVSAGYTVIVTGRDLDKLAQIVEKCNAMPDDGHRERAFAFQTDLYDMTQVDKLIDFVKTKFNRLDLLVNNACYRGSTLSILECELEDAKKVFHINLSIPMYLIEKCVVPLRLQRLDDPKPIVVNISSSASQIVVPIHLYSITKACLSEMTRQIAASNHDIHCITLSPGPVLTPERPHHVNMSRLTLMDRVGTTQEISNALLHVIDMPQVYNGTEFFVDGGYITKQKDAVAGQR